MTLRDLIEQARTPRRGVRVSVAEIAKRCGLHRTSLYDLMRGDYQPTARTVRALAEGLGVPVARVQKAVSR